MVRVKSVMDRVISRERQRLSLHVLDHYTDAAIITDNIDKSLRLNPASIELRVAVPTPLLTLCCFHTPTLFYEAFWSLPHFANCTFNRRRQEPELLLWLSGV